MSAGQPEVLGKYTLLRKLAAGGMAEVFVSRVAGPAGFEKTVVVKRILGHLAEDPSFIAMFLAEARLAAQLNHPNVVQVFDFGEQDGTWFLVMELIDGLNLRHLFRKAAEKGEYLPIGVALKIAIMALEGLAYAHEFADPTTGEPLALVHRDVSPDNILVGRNGAVKVVDFGIAKAANQTHLTRTGTVKGKFSYMPPEQLPGPAARPSRRCLRDGHRAVRAAHRAKALRHLERRRRGARDSLRDVRAVAHVPGRRS